MKKKKILILGASGFIGKNIAIHFSKKKNFNVIGTYFKNKTNIKNVKMLKCDLTSRKNTDKIIKGVDIIIQAAATTSGAKDIIEKPIPKLPIVTDKVCTLSQPNKLVKV